MTRFTYRHQRQDRYSVNTPPSTRPTPPPAPTIAPYTPNAFPRTAGSLNVVDKIDSAAGASSAPNPPCAARAATSIPKPVAAPPTADAAAKPSAPTRNVTLRPSRSPSRPPNSSRLPNASAYAVTTHCRSTVVKPRARCADGSAIFTTVASSTTMSCARAITPRTSQRLLSGWLPPFATAAGVRPPGVLDADIGSHLNPEVYSPLLCERTTNRRSFLRLVT